MPSSVSDPSAIWLPVPEAAAPGTSQYSETRTTKRAHLARVTAICRHVRSLSERT